MAQEKTYKNLDTAELLTGKLFVRLGKSYDNYVLITEGTDKRVLPRAIQLQAWKAKEPIVTDYQTGIVSDEFMELLQKGDVVEEATGDEHHREFLRCVFRYFSKHT